MSLGGNTLIYWVNKNYLRKLNLPEVHIYDRDVAKYAQAVEQVNSKPNCWAVQTQMLEIENYIHPSLYKEFYPIEDRFVNSTPDWKNSWSNKNIPEELSAFLKSEKEAGNQAIKNESASKIKEVFANQLSKKMKKELFEELNAYDEVNGWFEQIKKHL
ncbi:hypothetical protein [Gilliamella sp. Pas-s27]|uniref:hypothetical protein n=1 Tax=Gilliamella sp. Pas-s27 TaxID=2687311 RepID=UPI001365BA57|nr:hypothetical protein [Gilliamella sp. Pas-s27]MWP48033.1 hypothetical protein [Gilliamella sp. Pas-s27]